MQIINPPGLEPKGQNLFGETAASGTPQTGAPGQNSLGQLQQGFVETSNVNVVEELIGMIQTPATRIASVLRAPGGQLARVLNAYATKGELPDGCPVN